MAPVQHLFLLQDQLVWQQVADAAGLGQQLSVQKGRGCQ